jgi:hypothetical protein
MKFVVQGREISGEFVSFTEVQRAKCVLLVEGYELDVQMVVSNVIQTEEVDQRGIPIFMVDHSVVISGARPIKK